MLHKYLSIGEFSKLTELPSRTLHFYDQKGVLKPAKVDPDTNYRYYSTNQILDADLIKVFKFLGVPLNKIEKVQAYSSTELLQFLNEQEILLEEKIKKINEVQKNIHNIKQSFIPNSQESENEEVYIKEIAEQYILKLNISNSSELEVWSQFLNNIVQSYGNVTKQTIFGGIIPFTTFHSFDEIQYDSVFIPIMEQVDKQYLPKEVEPMTLEAGKYAVISFSITSDNYLKMYNKLQDYVKHHNLVVTSSIYEYFYPLKFKLKNASSFDFEFRVKVSE